jgi:hypothetical protein
VLRLNRVILALGLLCWVSPVAAQAASAGAKKQAAAQAGCPHAHDKAQAAQRPPRTIVIVEPDDGSLALLGRSAFAP